MGDIAIDDGNETPSPVPMETVLSVHGDTVIKSVASEPRIAVRMGNNTKITIKYTRQVDETGFRKTNTGVMPPPPFPEEPPEPK